MPSELNASLKFPDLTDMICFPERLHSSVLFYDSFLRDYLTSTSTLMEALLLRTRSACTHAPCTNGGDR